MSKFKIYKLRFTSPLHISDLRDDGDISQRTIHSDTLHAALISCLAKVGALPPANGDLGCVTSDLFPYYQKQEDSTPIYFLPMPLQTKLAQQVDPANAKKAKKVQWVDARLYPQLLNGEKVFNDAEELLDMIKASYLTKDNLPADISGSMDFVRSEVMQRASVTDRTGKAPTTTYYIDRITFKAYSGLYFLVREKDDTSLLDKALRILETEGIGTDRHVGYGFFNVTTDSRLLDIPAPADADHAVCLSTFIPEDKEQLTQMLNSEHVAYDFTRRGGWITSHPYTTLRKNAIHAFLPGSVFRRVSNVDIVGRIVNLQPQTSPIQVEHPVWRNGKAIVLPIKAH